MNLHNQRFSNYVLPDGRELDVKRLVLFCQYSKSLKTKVVDIYDISVKNLPLKESVLSYLRTVPGFHNMIESNYIVITEDNHCIDGRHRLHICSEKSIGYIKAIVVPTEDINSFIVDSSSQ